MTDQIKQEPTQTPSWSLYGPNLPGVKPPEKIKPSYALPPEMKVYTDTEVESGMPADQGYQLIPKDWGFGMIKQFFGPNKSYFAEDPRRLAKYYYFGATRPEGWQAPYWFDQNKYAQAFDYMQAMQGDDWKQWKPFDPDDPSSIYLSSLMPPPKSFQIPGEVDEQEDIIDLVSKLEVDENGLVNIGQLQETEYDKLMQYLYGDEVGEISPLMDPHTWQESELWQQVALSIMSPQPIEGRPEWSRALGSLVQTGMAAMGGWQAGASIAAVGSLIGTTAGVAVGGPVGAIAGAIGGLVLGGAAFGSAYYGRDVPWANTILRVLDISDEVLEKIVGVGIQLATNDTKEVLENLPAAWSAGMVAYETEFGAVGNVLLNTLSKGFEWAESAVNALGGDVEWSSGMTADWTAGEVWALERGIWEPALVRDGMLTGSALDETRSRIAAGEDKEDVFADMMFRYGYSGNIADFVMQMVTPGFIEAMPWASNKLLGKYADYTNNPNLKFAVDSTRGYLAVDMLPFGIQNVFEGISSKAGWEVGGRPLIGSRGMFDTLGLYKNILRKGDLPLEYWPTVDVPPQTVFDINPDMSVEAGQVYSDAITKHATKSSTSDVFVLDMDAVNTELRTYFEDSLTKAGVNLDTEDVKILLDSTVEQIHNTALESMLNNPGTTEVEMTNNINKAIGDYVSEVLGMIQVDEGATGIKYYPQPTDWERRFAKLTDEGRYAELEPRERRNAFDTLTTLTPESQAIIYLNNLVTNTGALLQGFENDPDGMFRMIRMAAGVDPVLVGQVAGAMIESPATKTTAPVLRAFVESGILDQMQANIKITEGQRSTLHLLAREFDEKPGKMLETIENNPQKVIQMLVNAEESGHYPALKALFDDVRSGVLTADSLHDGMSVFMGKNYVPFTNDMIQAEIMQELIKYSDDFVVERYGIKEKAWYMRMSDAMKSYMSLAVLGFNPLYAVYNYVNNITTRAAQGVFGFHTKNQIDLFWERFGIKPAMLEVGLSLGTGGDVEHVGGRALAAAMDKGDWISKVKKAGTKASKLGIFSNISGMIEVAESRQATTIGTMQMWDQLWRPGAGFTKMDVELEGTLRQIHPQLPEQIYGLVKQGMNMDDVIGGLYSRSKIDSVENILTRTINDIASDQPEVVRDLMTKTGLLQELTDLMEGAETRQDINNVYDYINSRIQAVYEQNLANDLITIPEDVANRIKAEGWSAMMPLWSELWAHFTSRRLLDIVENGITADQARLLRANKEYGLARDVWRKRSSEAESQWKRTHNMMLATTKGMIDAIGTDSVYAQNYINLMTDWASEWDGFYAKRKKLYNDYADANLTGDARKALWDETSNKVNKLYDAHLTIEQTQLTSMFENLGKVYEETSHRPASEVTAWADEVIKAWDDMGSNIKTFREGLLKGDFTDAEMRSMWNKFNEETFLPGVNKQRDAMMQGAYDLANNQPVNMPDVEPTTAPMPILTPEMVDANARIARAEQLKTTIIERAQKVGEYKASDKQRQLLASVLSEVYPDSGDRHTVQKYLYDTASVMDARDTMVKASLDLFTAVDEAGESVRAIPDNIRVQMEGLLEAAYENQGQGSLWDGRPADNAPAADKAKYNEKKIKTDYEKSVTEQTVESYKKMQVSDLQQSLRAAGYTVEETNALISLLEVRAKRQGESINEWIGKRIAAVISTDDPEAASNILYQGGNPLPTDPSLTALHNLRLEELYKVLQNEGMPMPSIAITKQGIEFSHYGEVTMVGNKNIVDPELDPANKVYPSDAYTVTTPKTYKTIDITDKLVSDLSGFLGIDLADMTIERAVSNYRLHATVFSGERVSSVEITNYILGEMDSDQLNNIGKRLIGEGEYGINTEGYGRLKNAIAEYITNHPDLPDYTEVIRPSLGEFPSEIPATLENLTMVMKAYTEAHDPLGGGKPGVIKSVAMEPFSSLDDMRRSADSLVDYDEFSVYMYEVQEPALKKLVEIIDDIIGEEGGPEYDAEGWWIGDKGISNTQKVYKLFMDYAKLYGQDMSKFKDFLFETFVYKSARETGGEHYKRLMSIGAEFETWPDMVNFYEAAVDAYKTIINAPTLYFEAKPERTVRLSEWSAVVVPDTTPDYVIQNMRDNGLVVQTYELGNTKDRMAKIDQIHQDYNTLFQDQHRGAINFLDDGRAIIRLFKSRDVSTMVHEIAHIFRRDLTGAELDVLAKQSGLTSGEAFLELQAKVLDKTASEIETQQYTDAEEYFAKGFEEYMKKGMAEEVAPPALISLFQKFAKWLQDIYNAFTGNKKEIEMSQEMRSLFDGLLFEQDNLDALANNKRILDHAPTGETTTAIGVTTHADYNLQFKIVDLFDLVVSHDLNFIENKYFPQELQGRFRELGANRAQIYEIAMALNPNEILNDTRTVETGPMIIGNDMVVESGNGRTLALLMAVRDFPDKWAEYVNALSMHLEDKGFSPDALEGIEHPVLVRVRLDDVDRVAFADDTNASRTKTMTTQETAYTDAKYWSAQLLADLKVFATTNIESLIKSENNRDVVQSYLSAYPPNERGKYYTAAGNEVSQEGINRLAASIIARVFEGEEGRALVEYMYSSTSGEAKNIEATIKNVLGEIAKIEGKIELGQLYPEMSIANMFSEVVLAYLSVKERYGSYAEFERNWANQPSIFGDAFVDIGLVDPSDAPEIRQIKIDLFQFYGENNKKVSALTQLWKRYADKVLSQPEYMVDQMQLIPMEITPRHTILENVLQDLVNEGRSNEFGDYIRKAQPGLGLDAEEGPTLYQTKVFDDVPPGGLPIPQYEGKLTEEVFTEKVSPILDHMRRLTLDDLTSGKGFALADLPDDVAADVNLWMHGLREQMASAKLVSMDYGEMMRNRALLNYQERYGIDEYLNMIYPYQFWFTRTMGEWGKRMIEKPEWIRMYRRIREHQKRMGQAGVPSRLEGKFRIPAPWLPDFMGDAIHIDPLGQMFPFTEFSTPFEMMAQTGQDVEYATMQIIQGMVKEGMITSDRARQAIENRDDPLWLQALSEAQTNMQQSGELTPMNITSMMMSPAMWWNYPYHIMKGTPEKLYPLPGTRFGQAMRTWGQPFKMIGDIMAYPEEQLRRKFNISSFGEWGDYYIDRHISNLVGEGAISVEDGLIAMIEKKGEAYDMAYQLAEKEWALKLPGSESALAIKEGKFGGLLYTLPTTLFPSGILPDGEMIQRGLKVEYSKAWNDYKKGNPTALNEFFDKHPEYQARLALFQEPEERMRQFLISSIWEKWGELDNKNKPLVIEQLGRAFETNFMEKDTRNYEAIDVETLAYWSQLLGGYVPDTEATKAIKDLPLYKQKELQLYNPEVLAQVEDFYQKRSELYPNYRFLQTTYFQLPEDPKNVRKGFIKQYPELKEYWEWKDDYYKNYPLVKQYQDESGKRYQESQGIYTDMKLPDTDPQDQMKTTLEEISNNEPALLMQLMFSVYSGNDVEGGAKTMLNYLWMANGSPGTYEEWERDMMYMIMGQ
jgi:hypothetical protein